MKVQNSPWDPRLSPWSAKCSPWDPRCSQEFYVVVREDKSSDVFNNLEDALYFIGEYQGTVHKVNSRDRVYPFNDPCCGHAKS